MARPPDALMADHRLNAAAKLLAWELWWPIAPDDRFPMDFRALCHVGQAVGLRRSAVYTARRTLTRCGWCYAQRMHLDDGPSIVVSVMLYAPYPELCEQIMARGAPEPKTVAYYAVFRALKSGVLVRPSACSRCPSSKPIDAHHDDYSAPLAVRWLCRSCHMKWHRAHGKGLNGEGVARG